MRKMIGVLMMVAVVVVGFLFMMNQSDTTTQEENTKTVASETKTYKDAQSAIDSIKKQIEENYPTTAEGVVELHNELMGICYKYDMSDKDIENYVKTIRKIYASSLTEINPEADQIAQLKEERKTMSSEQMELITSKITEIYVAKNDSGKEVSAEINVAHATNLGGTNRTYFLSKEDGLWKINSWETMTAGN